MRAIKLRLFDRTENRMIYLEKVLDPQHHIFSMEDGHLTYRNLQNGSGGDEYIIMQYTGLKDKNGKEIYEGDIVHYKSTIDQWGKPLTHEQVGKIEIDKGMTRFRGKTKQTYDDVVSIHDSKFLFLSSNIYEVIGNIYENPELI